MLAIGHVIRNGVVFDFKNCSRDIIEGDDLLYSVRHLFDLLDERRVNYVLVGGVALLQYVEGRNTQDIHLLMALSALDKLPEIESKSQDNDFARGEPDQHSRTLDRRPARRHYHRPAAEGDECVEYGRFGAGQVAASHLLPGFAVPVDEVWAAAQ